MPYALGLSIGATTTVSAVVVLPSADGEIGEPPAPDITLHDTCTLISTGRPTATTAPFAPSITANAGRLTLTDAELQYVAARLLARVGDPVPLLARPEMAAERVAARLAVSAIESVAAERGEEPAAVVVMHPGSWQGHRRAALAAALADAGLPHAALLSRPVVTALRYAERTGLDVGQSLVTLDIGTRAAECATVRRSAIDTFEIVGRVNVDTNCGATAVDDALLAHLTPAAAPATELDARRSAVVAAKEALSYAPDVMVADAFGSGSQRLTRAEFDDVIAPVLRRVGELVERTLEQSPDATAVTLVGGAATVPAIALALGDTVVPPVVVDEQPRVGVAAGAAIAAWFLALEAVGDEGEEAEFEATEERAAGLGRLFPARQLLSQPTMIARRGRRTSGRTSTFVPAVSSESGRR